MAPTDKEKALRDLQQGEALKTVRERYGIKRNTLNAWVSRWRKAGTLPAIGGQILAPHVTDNVVTLPRKPRKPEKAAERIDGWKDKRTAKRSRAIPPVDRSTLRRIARRLIAKLDTGLMCPTCDGESAQPLSAQDFSLYTRAYVQQLDALARSLEVEGTLSDADTGDDALDLDSPETIAALGRSLIQLGPRRLAAVLEADGKAARIVRAALAEMDRQAV